EDEGGRPAGGEGGGGSDHPPRVVPGFRGDRHRGRAEGDRRRNRAGGEYRRRRGDQVGGPVARQRNALLLLADRRSDVGGVRDTARRGRQARDDGGGDQPH